jgi:signal transduction histidine kinase
MSGTVGADVPRRRVSKDALLRAVAAEPSGLLGRTGERTRTDRFADALGAILSCVPAAIQWGSLATGHRLDAIAAVDLGLTTVIAPLMWWRRRFPLALSLLTSAASTVSLLLIIAQGLALLTVAILRRPRAVAVAALAYFGSGLIYAEVRPSPKASFATTVLVIALLTVGNVAWGSFLRARRALVASLRDRARRLEDEQTLRIEQARQLERTRIAREMHDVLAHRISLLSLHAGALEFRPDAPPEEIAKAAGVIRGSAHQALQELREVIGVLRAPENGADPERPQPTLGDVPALVTEARHAGAKIDLDVRIEEPDALPAVTGRTAYRIVQEGLTNARKHAPGAAVRVTVSGDRADGLTVEVRNWLPVRRSAPEIPGAGSGIVGLNERVDLAGGRLESGATTAGDFRLRAWLPWPV